MRLTQEKTTLRPTEQTVDRYFQTFNQGNFWETARLFAETGQLLPPFEEPIVGPDAIYAYLQREAEGMQARPKTLSVDTLSGDRRLVTVKGSVSAIVFNVNAAWIFELDDQDKIQQVEVKLLASLQELFALRPAR